MVNDGYEKYSSFSILFRFDSKQEKKNKNWENNKIVETKTQNVQF